jgi:tetratricopeptide (TPR) repeat protein
MLLLMCGSASASGGVRLGVLEFENITKDSNYSWVSRGIQESLSSKLAALPNVVVIERGQINKILEEQRLQTSGFVDTATAVEVGKLIGIKKAVTGSFQVNSTSILISARVVDVETSETDEGFEVQGGVDDIFSHYTKLATDLSGALTAGTGSTATAPVQVENLAAQQKQEIARQDTTSFSAYEYYTKANEVAFGSDSWITALIEMIDKGKEISDSEQVTREAAGLLEKAVEVDPNYARAWALLGTVYGTLDETVKADSALNKALSIAQDDPFILCTYGVYIGFAGGASTDIAKSLSAFQQVRRDFPNTYYSGLASLFVVLIKMTQDENFVTSGTKEGLSLLTDARTQMPDAGFVRAFHGMFAILDLFSDLGSVFASGDISLPVVSDSKKRLDIAIFDIDEYIKAFPGSMIATEINTFLPDAKALQAMFGALEVQLQIGERTGNDMNALQSLPDAERSKYVTSLKLHLGVMHDYVRNFPQGMLVATINDTVLPTIQLYVDALEGWSDSSQQGQGDQGLSGLQNNGSNTYGNQAISLDEGINTAYDYIINGDPLSAIELLGALDQQYPNTYDVYVLMSVALIHAEEYDAAADVLSTTIDSWPDQPDPYYWAGILFEFTGDYSTAYQYYTAYLSMAPNGSYVEDAYNRAYQIEQAYSGYGY